MNKLQTAKFNKIAEEYKLDTRDVSQPLCKRFTKQEIRQLIFKLFGNTSQLCKTLDCTRSQLTSYLEKQQDLKQDMKDAKEAVVDKAEQVMTSLLDSSNEQIQQKTAEFLLKTLGKSRGYDAGAAQQITVEDGKVDIKQIFGI